MGVIARVVGVAACGLSLAVLAAAPTAGHRPRRGTVATPQRSVGIRLRGPDRGGWAGHRGRRTGDEAIQPSIGGGGRVGRAPLRV